jgi:folate-dependent phosphoribosylglycinamide formyltransferase PurN
MTERPLRVVMFGGGPVLERDVRQFLVRLEAHPDIELLAAICQSQDQSWRAVVGDLWQRRRLLAIPLLVLRMAGALGRMLARRSQEVELNRQVNALAERIIFVPDIHAPEVLARVRTLQPDLGLIYGSPILKPALFQIPRCGTLGIHHGKVPQYRGKKTTFWAIYNGETEAGVTIQRVNAGLDTGEVVNSGSVPIGRRSYSAVWNDLVALGLELYIRSILEVRAGKAVYRPQEGLRGQLYRDPTLPDIVRFWRREAGRRLSML